MLHAEVWAVILTYLTLIALLNVSLCSKILYVLAHENKKFEKTFRHSKFIVSNVDMYEQVRWILFAVFKRLQHKVEKLFHRDLMFFVKKCSCLMLFLTYCLFVSIIISLIATGIFMFIIGVIFAHWSGKRK